MNSIWTWFTWRQAPCCSCTAQLFPSCWRKIHVEVKALLCTYYEALCWLWKSPWQPSSHQKLLLQKLPSQSGSIFSEEQTYASSPDRATVGLFSCADPAWSQCANAHWPPSRQPSRGRAMDSFKQVLSFRPLNWDALASHGNRFAMQRQLHGYNSSWTKSPSVFPHYCDCLH